MAMVAGLEPHTISQLAFAARLAIDAMAAFGTVCIPIGLREAVRRKSESPVASKPISTCSWPRDGTSSHR